MNALSRQLIKIIYYMLKKKNLTAERRPSTKILTWDNGTVERSCFAITGCCGGDEIRA